MAANSANRETTRDTLHTLFVAKLTGAGPVEEVHNGLVGDFGKKSPVVIIADGVSDRQAHGIGSSKWDNRFTYRLLLFVAEADKDNATQWDDQDVQDRLDLVEKSIADVLADNRKSPGNWAGLWFEGPNTDPITVTVGGLPYRLQVVEITARVFDA